MLAIARKTIIREQLREHKSVRITELAELLNVTNETIRRDLRSMEKDGDLIRTHGGAYILDGVQNDLDLSTRQFLRTGEKEIISEKCSSIIQNGDYIFLDASSTAWFIARAIMHRKVSVLTVSLEIINLLSTSSTIRLFAVGGEYSSSTKSFTGNSAIQNLEHYYFDKAFISCRSVSLEAGLTDTNVDDAMLHRLALAHAHEKYLAIDNSKLNRASFAGIAPVSGLDGIILDQPFPEDWVRYLNEHSVQIY
ncbi:MAG: DeoR/GlpR transcriptional regulator [Parasporobacterium sp.]|nr:DeoR/GlpR transcriptional regulator [Parasporobacterium sp.]